MCEYEGREEDDAECDEQDVFGEAQELHLCFRKCGLRKDEDRQFECRDVRQLAFGRRWGSCALRDLAAGQTQ